MGMRVIETVRDNRDGVERDVDWGVIRSDLGAIQAIATIIGHQRDRENGEVHAFQGRLTTTKITITMEG